MDINFTKTLQYKNIKCLVLDHEKNDIIYYCNSKKCLLPLCQDCIQIHSEFHEKINKVPILKKFNDIRDYHSERISENLRIIQSEMSYCDLFMKTCELENCEDLKSFRDFKEKFIKVVNDYLTNIENDYIKYLKEDSQIKVDQVKKILHELVFYDKELSNMKSELIDVNAIDILNRLYKFDIQNQLDQVFQMIDKNNLYKYDKTIKIDSFICDNVKQLLENSLQISSTKGTKGKL